MVVNQERPTAGEVIAETRDYRLVVIRNPDMEGLYCYGIRNKKTHVDEYWTLALPRARFVLAQIQEDATNGVGGPAPDDSAPNGVLNS